MLKTATHAVAEAVTRAKDALLTDVATAASTHRQNLILAQASLERAEAELQAAHDLDLDGAEVERLEGALAMAKVALSRAEGKYLSAERRLRLAENSEALKAKAEAIDRRDQALAIRLKAAQAIDELAAKIARHVQTIDAQDSILADCARLGAVPAATGHLWNRGQRTAELALSKAGAIGRIFVGDPTQAPGAADIVERDNGALTGGLPS